MTLEQFFSGKRVLVTGDTGFKGAWLASWLNLMGARVYGFALPPEDSQPLFDTLDLSNRIDHTDGDIRNFAALSKKFAESKPEIVFHLAAQSLVLRSYDDPQFTFETNVAGSVNVLEAVRRQERLRSLVYVTTDKCYQNNEWVWGYRESDRLGGHDPYSASKACAELALESYQRSFFAQRDDLGVASVRAGNVIGGGDWADNRIVPDCVRALSQGETISVRNPESRRPWQHVLEPLGAYLLLARRLYDQPSRYRGPWNIGPDITSNRTVRDLVATLIASWGAGEAEYGEPVERPLHEAGLLQLNCDKAAHLLGWRPALSFEETIATTCDWYRRYEAGEDPWELTTGQIKAYLDSNQTIRETAND